MRRFFSSIAIAALSACQDATGDDTVTSFGTEPTSTAPPTTTVATTESGSGSETGSSSGAQDSSSSSAGSSESSGSGESSSTGEVVTEPCTTLDVLVVIDDSDTMAEEQAKLAAALDPFFALVDMQLPGIMQSIRVAVITTDAPEFVTMNPMAVCTPYASGMTWMSYGPSLTTELACAAAQGTMGDPDERPMQRAIEALSPELQGLDAPNEGFLRESGPLVLIVVTDEEDDFEEITEWGSEGDPPDWRAALADTQDGHVQDVVPLFLIGVDTPNNCPPFQWNGLEGAELSPRLQELAESFPHHAVGDACAEEYTSFLNVAGVPQIVDACNFWVPE